MNPSKLLLVNMLLLFTIGTTAQETPPQTESAQIPYEIIITPRISRAGLRDLIEDVEEDFYEKFNELNIEKAYDIVCYKYKPTMSHIPKRVCEPIFMLRHRGNNASRGAALLGSGSVDARESATMFMESDRQLYRERKDDYRIIQELMDEFIRSNREFRAIAEVLAELKYRLDNYGQLDP